MKVGLGVIFPRPIEHSEVQSLGIHDPNKGNAPAVQNLALMAGIVETLFPHDITNPIWPDEDDFIPSGRGIEARLVPCSQVVAADVDVVILHANVGTELKLIHVGVCKCRMFSDLIEYG